MGVNEQEFEVEKKYLDGVLDFLRSEISSIREALESKKHLLYRTRHEQGVLASDFTSPGTSSDLSQNLLEDERQINAIEIMTRRLYQDERLLASPYFGRFDFKEDGMRTADKIYIGLHNIYDSEGDCDILVYDWRAPISGIFYRDEPGHASYTAPGGEISGDVSIKRQYNIEHSTLKYFFNCSLVINDEILQEALAKNASTKMQNIVRTIQSEQDLIIRNTKSDLLMAQGAAGSGKTTIALHRIAYLLYHDASLKLTSNNIVIISLSDVFSSYIGTVLPTLGEENVKELTFDMLAQRLTGIDPLQSRIEFSDSLLKDEKENGSQTGILQSSYLFKGSRAFAEILQRFLHYYENNLIAFDDVVYGGTAIAKRDELRNIFMDNNASIPTLSRLRRLETILKSRIDRFQPAYHKKLENEIINKEEHQFDFKTVARFLAIQEMNRVTEQISKFTQIDAAEVYREIFADRLRFEEIAKGLDLPENIGDIFELTSKYLNNGFGFEDMAPLCHLTLLLDRNDSFEGIKQVVVDEAQDYLPMHYAVLGQLFKAAAFTVLGDIGQSVETNASSQIYDDAAVLLKKKRPVLLTLNKSYRCSCDIMNFALKIPDERPDVTPFERYEKEPELIRCTDAELDDTLAADIKSAIDEGFDTAAVICKTQEQAQALYEQLRGKVKIKILASSGEVARGAIILPAYLSKGLEFDCVFVPEVTDENYGCVLSKRLLYIACTRALHRLRLYYGDECEIVKRLRG
jgi:DNA helicase II / ATP-dependent DNA helicase PcrA